MKSERSCLTMGQGSGMGLGLKTGGNGVRARMPFSHL